MMTANELCKIANEFANYTTCYLKGGIGKYLDQSWYDSLLRKYPDNAKYNNGEDGHYVNTDAFAFDCITFIKSMLAGCTTKHHLNDYTEYNKCPIGDCTTKAFKEMLIDKEKPSANTPCGYGLATDGHAGLSLGNGVWGDCNYFKNQNGVMVHIGGIERFDVAGKIPTIDYSEKKDEVQLFLEWLYKEWKGRNK